MINSQLFPKHLKISGELTSTISAFHVLQDKISSLDGDSILKSNEVLEIVCEELEKLNYKVETSKKSDGLIEVPVMFGLNGKPEKQFLADALSSDGKIVIEVEAGRAYTNNQFLKDIFQASMMVDVEYLVLAVRNHYRKSDDFTKIYRFIDVMYLTGRIKLDLKGILLIGY